MTALQSDPMVLVSNEQPAPTKPKTLTEMVFEIQQANDAVAYAQQDVDDAIGRLSTAKMSLQLACEAAEPLRALLAPPQAATAKRGSGRPRKGKTDGSGVTDFIKGQVKVGAEFECADISRKWTADTGTRVNVWSIVGCNVGTFKKISGGRFRRVA